MSIPVMPRHIIQIAASAGGPNNDRLYALCDDGTVWTQASFGPPHDRVWVRLPSIPQERGDDR